MTAAQEAAEIRTLREHEAVGLGIPQIPALTAEEKRAILRGDRDALARLGPELIDWARAVINAPTDYVTRQSFGFREKRALADMILRRALPETLQVDVREYRQLSDADLVATAQLIVGELGPPALPQPVVVQGSKRVGVRRKGASA